MSLSNIQAVIFDWAGTTVDFGSISPVASFINAFKQEDLDVTMDEVRAFMGYLKKDHTRAILETPRVQEQFQAKTGRKSTEEDVERIYTQVEPMMASTVVDYAIPIHGAIDIQNTLRDAGVKIGSTTGYSAMMMEKIVPAAKERGYDPDSWVCPSENMPGRPAPFMVYQNLIQLQRFPLHHMVKVGDTVSDMQEGVNAGMWCVGFALSGNECGVSWEEFQEMDESVKFVIRERATQNLIATGAHVVVDGIWDLLPVLEEIGEKIAKGERP